MFGARQIVGMLASVFALGCSPEYIEQQVTGIVKIEDRPARGLAVRLQTGEQSTCDDKYLSLATDAAGGFSGTRRAALGKMAVIVQKDTLCVLEGNKWKPVWRGIYGPAPTVMNFICSRIGQAWKCTMNGVESHLTARC